MSEQPLGLFTEHKSMHGSITYLPNAAIANNARATSREAAESLSSQKIGKQAQQVLAFLRERGTWGATLEEIEQGTGLEGNSVRPRRKWLEDHGLVIDSGETRLNAKNHNCVVWFAADISRSVLTPPDQGTEPPRAS